MSAPVLVERPTPRVLKWLYLVDLALLATHEVDSAYWLEWEIFGLPGGIQLFLLLNLLLFLGFLVGLVDLVQERDRGLWLSLALSGAGILAFTVHAVSLATGRAEFRLPTSMAILSLALVFSLIQGSITLRVLLERRDAGGDPIE